MSDDLLSRASEVSRARVTAAGGDPRDIPDPWRTFAAVETAQAILDNGGLEYFYESDFPGKPPYSFFSQAFEVVGARRVAAIIERTSQMFPFSDPHLHVEARRQWIESVADRQHEFSILSDRACGDEEAFTQLATYVRKHLEAFGAA